MNARVFLLALVTAAFMAIWDADRPLAARAVMAQSELQNEGMPIANVLADRPSSTAEASRTLQDNTAASDSAWTTATSHALIPLPEDLQPGTWQAISRDGDTFRITIERNSLLSDSTSTGALATASPEVNVCVITALDGLRWCFIKEHPKTVQQAAAVQR